MKLLRYSFVSLAIVLGFITIVASVSVPPQTSQTRCEGIQFTDLENGTIRDECTGLIWLEKADALGQMTWGDALTAAATLDAGDFGWLDDGSLEGDWRLPTLEEWKAFVDTKYDSPVLSNAAGDDQWTEGDLFYGVQSSYYWSSDISGESFAGVMALQVGITFSNNVADSAPFVWPVRSTTVSPPNAYTFDAPFEFVTAGIFLMGSPDGTGVDPDTGIDDGDEAEPGRSPYEYLHEVTLTQNFYMQATEMTQGQWSDVLTAAEDEGIDIQGLNKDPSAYNGCGETICTDYPVESVSWDDIQVFIAILNELTGEIYNLPTEAQWEYAARAGSTTAFANGQITVLSDAIDPVLEVIGWYYENSGLTIHPVVQLIPNIWGLYDMHGNVREWCLDANANYTKYPDTDPLLVRTDGPPWYKVIRDGNFDWSAGSHRVARRTNYAATYRSSRVGFRLVMEP